jgi:hypothetical protein
LRVSGCPQLRQLAIQFDACNGPVFDEIVLASPALRELAIDATCLWGPAESAALARLQQLESLELRSIDLEPCVLREIAKLPHLKQLTLLGCSFVPSVVGAIVAAQADSIPVDGAPMASSAVARLSRCRYLEELTFGSEVDVPDDLAWIKDLKSLRRLDLSLCRLTTQTVDRWAPETAPNGLNNLELRALGHPLIGRQAIEISAGLPALKALTLSREQTAACTTADRRSKFAIDTDIKTATRFWDFEFGWRANFVTDPAHRE